MKKDEIILNKQDWAEYNAKVDTAFKLGLAGMKKLEADKAMFRDFNKWLIEELVKVQKMDNEEKDIYLDYILIKLTKFESEMDTK